MSSEQRICELTDIVNTILSESERHEIRALLDELQPFDLGQIFFQLPEDRRGPFLSQLKNEEIAELLKDLEHHEQALRYWTL